MNRVSVIGLGYLPLSSEARDRLLGADLILASRRLEAVFQRHDICASVQHKVRVIEKIDSPVAYICDHMEDSSLAVLASGDPLFFGIGRRLIRELGRERVEIYPNLSSVQLAFAAIGEAWDDALLMSLHGGPDPEKRRRLRYTLQDLPSLLEGHPKIAILTDRENSPARIAEFLHRAGLKNEQSLRLYVCEKLGYPDARITSGTPAELFPRTFADPNVVIIVPADEEGQDWEQAAPNACTTADTTAADPAFGLREDELLHSRGLITKNEVRAVALHSLRLPRSGVFWDIGAGSGSISIEAARLCPGLNVYAIEKNGEQLANIRENVLRFGVANVTVVAGAAPAALDGLPAPDRIFIGGSVQLSGVMDAIGEKMPRGVIVLNAIALETINEALQLMAAGGWEPEVSQISASRSKLVNGRHHMSANNPIFVVRGERR